MTTRRTPLGRSLLGAALALSTAAGCHASSGSPAARGTVVTAPPPPARIVRLTRDLGFTGVAWLVELRELAAVPPGRRGAVQGEMRVTTGGANAEWVARQFGCRVRPTAGTDGGGEPLLACAVPFARGAPDWAALLARLDALGVMGPPRDTAPADSARREPWVCTDGSPWGLEVLVAGAAVVRDAQVCGPTGPRRSAYEAGVDSVLDVVADAGRVRR